jgi:hypothetical protein
LDNKNGNHGSPLSDSTTGRWEMRKDFTTSDEALPQSSSRRWSV